jgi:hypothetical protein
VTSAPPNPDLFREELDRILSSETLRGSESLRRLLGYLGEAYLAGNARQLKEYTIGRDVMGKPEDYDPRVDSSVRVQIGKLRQRLEQYYREEGTEAQARIVLPKGHFELGIEAAPNGVERQGGGVRAPQEVRWRMAAVILGLMALAAAIWGTVGWRRANLQRDAAETLSAELREFWGPFLGSPKPLMVVLGSPLFVRFHNHYFRNPWANDWEEVEKAVPLEAMRKLLESPTAPSETRRWTPLGEAMAAFRLASMLAPVKREVLLKRSTTLAWEDVKTNNIVFLGPSKFNRQIAELPVAQDFVIEGGGVKNLRPQPGERSEYRRDSPPELEEIPADYAVVTRVRGLEGWGELLVLASSSTEGTLAAAEYVTTSAHLREMMGRLREGGRLPERYQVLLLCRFKAQVPIRTEYVTHHVLK